MAGHSVEEIKKETRVYLMVFVALAALTAITVGVSYLHLTGWRAISLALTIAIIKGSLVAGFFMHLLTEKKLIYSVLLLTLFFFAVLMWMPFTEKDSMEGMTKHVPEGVSHGVH